LFHHGHLLCSRELLLHTRSISCPPPTLTLVPAGLLLSHFSFLSPSSCCTAAFPFLRSLLPECSQQHSWLSSGQQWVPFGAVELLYSDMRHCWALLTEATSVPSLDTKTWPLIARHDRLHFHFFHGKGIRKNKTTRFCWLTQSTS